MSLLTHCQEFETGWECVVEGEMQRSFWGHNNVVDDIAKSA